MSSTFGITLFGHVQPTHFFIILASLLAKTIKSSSADEDSSVCLSST
jgi:hypothetical protein